MYGLICHLFILISLYVLGYLESGGGFGSYLGTFFHKLFKSPSKRREMSGGGMYSWLYLIFALYIA